MDPSHDVAAATAPDAIDPGDMYVVVRKAVEDAILSIVGRVVLGLFGLSFVWFGALVGLSTGGQPNYLQAAGGLVVALVGLYAVARALRLVPPIETWV